MIAQLKSLKLNITDKLAKQVVWITFIPFAMAIICTIIDVYMMRTYIPIAAILVCCIPISFYFITLTFIGGTLTLLYKDHLDMVRTEEGYGTILNTLGWFLNSCAGICIVMFSLLYVHSIIDTLIEYCIAGIIVGIVYGILMKTLLKNRVTFSD